MMDSPPYLMEHELEAQRLEVKTDGRLVRSQALWAGLKPGMRVADIGCGIGKTTFFLHRLAGPGGSVVGVDGSQSRIDYASKRYAPEGVSYVCRDIRSGIEDLGLFDFIWVRFFLEYWRSGARQIVEMLGRMLAPGGILCLIDLDYNCLTHHGIPRRLEKAIFGIMKSLEKKANFDPYAGRRLYSWLYDIDLASIRVHMQPYHLFWGEKKEKDAFNWRQKVLVSARGCGYDFSRYPGGFEGFYADFEAAFSDPRRFTYTPMILCRGEKSPAPSL